MGCNTFPPAERRSSGWILLLLMRNFQLLRQAAQAEAALGCIRRDAQQMRKTGAPAIPARIAGERRAAQRAEDPHGFIIAVPRDGSVGNYTAGSFGGADVFQCRV